MLEIGDNKVGIGYSKFVIAECGHNHQGDIETAKKIMRQVKDAGAQAYKLQKRHNRSLYTEEFFNSPYTGPTSYGRTYGEHREFLEFGWDEYIELKQYAEDLDIIFFATAFDLTSLEFLEDVGVPLHKAASASITNYKLLEEMARTGKPVLISTGGANKYLIRSAVEVVEKFTDTYALLQCTAAYPAGPEILNLRRIEWMQDEFECVVGFSDHQDGLELGAVAYALGARVFEKHVTHDHTEKGTDHAFSLEQHAFATYVKYIERTNLALRQVEQPLPEEMAPIRKMAQAIYTVRDVGVGEVISESDLSLKSPADGISARHYDKVVGLTAREPIEAETPLNWGMFEGGV